MSPMRPCLKLKKRELVFTTIALKILLTLGFFAPSVKETPFNRDIEVSRIEDTWDVGRCAWKKDKM